MGLPSPSQPLVCQLAMKSDSEPNLAWLPSQGDLSRGIGIVLGSILPFQGASELLFSVSHHNLS